MSTPLALFESSFVNDNDHLIQVWHVDLRESGERSPVGTLIKGCERKHAIEHGAQVRIATQAKFRDSGEGLIRDGFEAFVSRTEEVREIVEQPHARWEAQLFLQAVADASEQLQIPMQLTNLSMTTTRKTTDSVTYGRHGWIFSTSIEPTDEGQWAKWRRSMPDSYDHVSQIERPREFAGALGSMLAEQVGPRGKEQSIELTLSDNTDINARYPTQMVVHGPVVYVEDPYEVIAHAPEGADSMFRWVFVKGIEYRDQREYRFALWSEEEPARDVEYLTPSMTLLGAMNTR